MKKKFLAPLCSAFVIPGLGQVMNRQLKKGICILALVFFLFIVTLVTLYSILAGISQNNGMDTGGSKPLIPNLQEQDISLLWVVASVFAVVWLYSVIDAFVNGLKEDCERG
jgi:TM2 domain-containing membrane protein YozV